jgi:hypothetical protein
LANEGDTLARILAPCALFPGALSGALATFGKPLFYYPDHIPVAEALVADVAELRVMDVQV